MNTSRSTTEQSAIEHPMRHGEDAMFEAVSTWAKMFDATTFSETNPPKIGARSPGGVVESVDRIEPGIFVVLTCWTQLTKLSAARNKWVPKAFRQEGGWYLPAHRLFVTAMYPQAFITDESESVESKRDTAIRRLMEDYPRELEQVFGVDLGGKAQKESRRRFREIEHLTVGTSRHLVLDGATAQATSIPGADWMVSEHTHAVPIQRRFAISDHDYQALPSDFHGPDGWAYTGKRIVDMAAPSSLREVPNTREDILSLRSHWSRWNSLTVRRDDESHVSPFAEVEHATVRVGGGSIVAPRACLRGNVTLGDDVLIGRGAYIDDHAGAVTIPSELTIGDHARIRGPEHLIVVPSSSEQFSAVMHPVEHDDHAIGMGVTLSSGKSTYETFQLHDPELTGVFRGLTLAQFHTIIVEWFTDERFAELRDIEKRWAHDTSLRTLPGDVTSVVDLPWEVDDGAPLIGA